MYSYNLRKTGLEVEEIAVYRTLSVLIGVVWAAFLSAFVWPMEARRLLAQGTSDLLFNLAWLYQAIAVRAISSPEAGEGDFRDRGVNLMLDNGGELASLAYHLPSARAQSSSSLPLSTYQDDAIARMTLTVQVSVIWLEGLLAHTVHEVRLKGPFPNHVYRQILASAQGLLDSLQGLQAAGQLATDATGGHTSGSLPSAADLGGQPKLLEPVDSARESLALEVTGNTVLVLYLLAASFRIKTPLPPFMPRVESARQKLLDHQQVLQHHPTGCQSAPVPPRGRSGSLVPDSTPETRTSPSLSPGSVRSTSTTFKVDSSGECDVLADSAERTIRLYSYALGMKEVVRHAEHLTELTQRTLGVVGGQFLTLPR